MDDSGSALEEFRQRWKEEVSAKTKKYEKQPSTTQSGKARRPSEPKPERPSNNPPTHHPAADLHDDSDHDSVLDRPTGSGSDLVQRVEALSVRDVDEDEFTVKSLAQPTTALEFFEKAVEREDQGKLGDSLAHYRKAYKLDSKVDQTYKNKHFPVKSKPNNPNPSNAAVTVPSTAHHSSEPASRALSITELVQSFAVRSSSEYLP